MSGEQHGTKDGQEIGAIRFAVNRYVLTIGVFLAVVLFGLIATLRVPVNLLPEVEFPVLAIITTYPGGTPDDLDRRVSRVIEDQVSTIQGVTDVQSTSSTGVSQVVVFFRNGMDIDSAANEVSQRVNAARGALPDGAEAPSVQKFDPNTEPIITLAVTHAGEPISAVHEWADERLKPVLERVSGVAEVDLSGAPERQVEVQLNEGQLQAFGLTPGRVAQAIVAGAPDLPAGQVETSGRETSVATRAALTSLTQVENTVVDPQRGLRVADLGVVRDTTERPRAIARVNGENAVLVRIRKTSESNTVAVARGVHRALGNLSTPEGLELTVTDDQSKVISASVEDTSKEAIIVAVAVAVVVLITLGKLNTAFAVVLAIPISLAAAPIVFSLLGFSFNILTLLALIVAMGIVVDDSIVVAENVDRYRRLGYPLITSVLRGASEIFSAVSAATWSLLAVLLPISFIPGIIGQYFREFGLGLAAAIFFSWLEAIFFLTVRMAYTPDPENVTWREVLARLARVGESARWALRFLRSVLGVLGVVAFAAALWFAGGQRNPAFMAGVLAYPLVLALARHVISVLLSVLSALTGSLHAASERILEVARRGYVRSLRMALRRSWLVLVGAVVFFLSSFATQLPFAFTPPTDDGVLRVRLDLPPGTALSGTDRLVQRAEGYLREQREVRLVQTASSADDGTLNVQLIPREERAGIDALVERYRVDLQRMFASTPEVELSVAALSGEGGGGGARGTDLQLSLNATNRELLTQELPAILAVIRASEHVVSARTNVTATTVERAFVPSAAALTGTGLTPQDLAQTLRAYGEGTDAGTFRDGSESVPVKVKLRSAAASDENTLLALPAYSPTLNANLPLASLGAFEFREAPANINRSNKAYSVTLDINLTKPNPGIAAVRSQLEQKLRASGLTGQGIELGTAGAFSDAALLQELALYGLIAVGLALLLNYLVLGAQFNSFRYPLYLMLPVPLAMVGAVWALKLLGAGLDLISVLGMVILIGLVTKNAILLLDFVVERARTLPLQEALLESASLRLRPIVMTTLTVLVISFPLVFGTGQGFELRRSLGIVILGGILTSALLTLYVVPSAFYLFERRRLGHGGGRAGVGDAPLKLAHGD